MNSSQAAETSSLQVLADEMGSSASMVARDEVDARSVVTTADAVVASATGAFDAGADVGSSDPQAASAVAASAQPMMIRL